MYDYSPLGERVFFGLLSAGEVGLMVTSHWGSWFQGYSPLGKRVGCIITPRWGRGWVFGLLPTREVGLMVTSHWGSKFNGYFSMGKLVSGLLPAGERVG